MYLALAFIKPRRWRKKKKKKNMAETTMAQMSMSIATNLTVQPVSPHFHTNNSWTTTRRSYVGHKHYHGQLSRQTSVLHQYPSNLLQEKPQQRLSQSQTRTVSKIQQNHYQILAALDSKARPEDEIKRYYISNILYICNIIYKKFIYEHRFLIINFELLLKNY